MPKQHPQPPPTLPTMTMMALSRLARGRGPTSSPLHVGSESLTKLCTNMLRPQTLPATLRQRKVRPQLHPQQLKLWSSETVDTLTKHRRCSSGHATRNQSCWRYDRWWKSSHVTPFRYLEAGGAPTTRKLVTSFLLWQGMSPSTFSARTKNGFAALSQGATLCPTRAGCGRNSGEYQLQTSTGTFGRSQRF